LPSQRSAFVVEAFIATIETGIARDKFDIASRTFAFSVTR